jgi:hypothetical protein
MFVRLEYVTCFVLLFRRLESRGAYQIFGICEDLSASDNPLPKILDWTRVPNSEKEESLHNEIKCQAATRANELQLSISLANNKTDIKDSDKQNFSRLRNYENKGEKKTTKTP